ncbi:MAG: bifunctional methylenetetrahydrofolate dehydrogenase/methenyltetrahydrofolate cyclohydrolase FolD [Clostridiales bacterium]|nr:bifunctional methylenetetrahydrofolate dehydrogenase/methenyltetrahydrofolate cyclohydrolase FolD [Clostridiales bacterium]
MAATIMDGKALAAKWKENIKTQVAALSQRPGLAVILVGNDPASRVYVTNKEKDCAQCGIYSEEFALPAEIGQKALLELIDELNRRPEIDGILCQLPLPRGYDYDEEQVLQAIDPRKDVDAFHPYNVGRIMIGDYTFLPCTPAGVMALLDEYGIDPAGKRCVVVGRSNIVGKPQAMLLLHRHGTVTICHSRTPDLGSITREADILVSVVGKRNLITADMVKEGAAVIDVAMNRDENGKLCGDVDFAPVVEKAAYITPVPGGCGPMTRVMLLQNTLAAARVHGKE